VNLAKDIVETLREIPVREVLLHLSKIAVVADVVTFASLIQIFKFHFLPAELFCSIKRLENGNRVLASTSDVVDLAAPRIAPELKDEASNVERMDIVSNLFSLIPKHLVFPAFHIASSLSAFTRSLDSTRNAFEIIHNPLTSDFNRKSIIVCFSRPRP
jgi:hypothetical protein